MMSRASMFARALGAAIVASVFSLSACARAPAPAPAAGNIAPAPDTRLAAAPAATPKIGDWTAGTNYTLVERPQATNAGAGKIEVDEIFWYGCGHCYALDPALESWKTNKPAYIEFVRIPVVWGPIHRQHAKLFYTLQALGRTDLHSKVFDAIHQHGQQLAAESDETARALQLAFMKDHGVTAKDFNAAYDSMSVATNVSRAEDLTGRYAVASVPLIIVNGKYSTGVSPAGGVSQLLTLIDDLAASEKGK